MSKIRVFLMSAASQWLDLLTPSVANGNPIATARMRFFVAARLALGLVILALAPICLTIWGAPSPRETLQFIIALTPLASVAFLNRTGDLKLAQYISICGWMGLAASFAVTGGYESVSILLLSIALTEAALTLEIVTVAAAVGAIMALIAIDVVLQPAETFHAKTTAELALRLAPLILYLAALGVGVAMTEAARCRAERRSARDLLLLTNALGDIVIHFDRTGAVTSVIGDTHRIYGLKTQELKGRGFFQRVHVADRPAFLKLASDALAKASPTHAVLRLQVGVKENVDAGYTEPVFNYFEARTCSLDADDAGDVKAICTLRDVTVARRAEEEIVAARRQSEIAITAKTRFLAVISHELRTPLNAIIGFSEMLASEELEPKDPEKRREYSQIVANSGHHLHDVVNTILDMSKIESGDMQIFPEPFCLSTLVEQCCDMVQLKADQACVSLLRDLPRDLEEIVADRRACKQIVLNLLSNAIKFTPANGKVAARLRVEGAHILLSVSDDGVGIAPSDLGRLGDPFFQANSSHNRSFEGTGLGLSVVRGLVGLHGGAILVESALKLGTTVTVRLPQDSRHHGGRASSATRIETIARHGAASQGFDIVREKEVVKKIA